MHYSIVFYYIVLIIAQKYMLFQILVMKNIVISLKGFICNILKSPIDLILIGELLKRSS